MSGFLGGTLALALLLSGDAQAVDGAGNGKSFGFVAWGCGSRVRSQWRQHDGRVVAEETLDLEGGRWMRYRLQRHNVRQEVVAIRSGREIVVTIRKGESQRRVSLRPTGELLAGPTLVSHLAEALPTLQAGRPMEFDYLIAEQGIVLRLRATATAQGGVEGPAATGSQGFRGAVVVRVEAASVLLRAFVPATTLTFDAAGGLRSLSGRLLPQTGDVTKPKSLDGVLHFEAAETARSSSRMQSVCNTTDLS